MVGLRDKKVKVKQKTTIHKKDIYSIAKMMISGKDIVGTCTLVQNDLKYIFFIKGMEIRTLFPMANAHENK